ncbi:MAG: insulinase family protein [Rhodobacteraceae bacterium]|nr:insulinase family protein [Paracoccaceae bacterium]
MSLSLHPPLARAAAAALVAALPLASSPALAVEIEALTTPGGVEVWLVEERSIPFIALEMRFRGGGSLDDPDRRGATYLMAGLLEEGAGGRDAVAFETALDAIAASFSADAGADTLSVSARFLTEVKAEAVELIADALGRPRFDDEAITRLRDQHLSIIASRARNPRNIASDRLDALAFAGHPYAASHLGSAESVAAIDRDDLRAAHRAALTRDRIVVSVVGDIGPQDAAAMVDAILSPLPETGAPLPPRTEPALERGVTIVPFPGPQSLVAFGQRGIGIDDPDYFAAMVLNHVLGGGGFGSRLTEELRERRGLTYGIGTGLASWEAADMLLGQFSASNARAAEAKALVVAEWERMARDGITEEELRAARTYLTGAYPLRFSSNAAIARILTGMQLGGLPADYPARRNALVEAVTREDVARVAARLLDPEGLHFVVVGAPEGLEPTH